MAFISKTGTIAFVVLLFFCVPQSWSRSEIHIDDHYFDYMSTRRMLIYSEDGTESVGMANPFSKNSVEMGSKAWEFYNLILPYMANSVDMVIPMPEEPKYVVDLMSDDSYKRLYLGRGWINDGARITFPSDSDWESIEELLVSRLDRPMVPVSMDNIKMKFEQSRRRHNVTEEQETQSILEAIDEVEAIEEMLGDLERTDAQPILPKKNSITSKKTQLEKHSESYRKIDRTDHSDNLPISTKNTRVSKLKTELSEKKEPVSMQSKNNKTTLESTSRASLSLFIFVLIVSFISYLVIKNRR